MNTGLVKVRDFAQGCGCTPQNIYGHLKTYEAELEGHTVQGKGRQGVLLDEYAQDFLRSIMYPREIGDNALMEEISDLRGQLLKAETERLRVGSLLIETEGERDRALLEVGEYQKLLKASKEADEAKDKEIDQLKKDLAKATGEALTARKEADNLHLDLQKEKSRKLTWRERFSGWKKG